MKNLQIDEGNSCDVVISKSNLCDIHIEIPSKTNSITDILNQYYKQKYNEMNIKWNIIAQFI